MKIITIIIGDEILIGQVTDTNSGTIARAVAPIGGELIRTITVGDNACQIREALTEAVAEADVVITTGGLGPTKDDITKTVLAEFTGGRMVFNQEAYDNAASIMARRGLDLNRLTRSQAMVPDTCRPITNRCGTAPIMWFDLGPKCVIAMPGVPFETRAALTSDIVPDLAAKFGFSAITTHRTVLLTGRSESAVAEAIAEWEDNLPDGFHLAYLPNNGYLRLRIDGRSDDEPTLNSQADELQAQLAAMLGDDVWMLADLTPAEALLRELQSRHLTVSTAESCTSGRVAAALTAFAGSSESVMGGIVAYSNNAKMEILGVAASTLQSHGAVSLPVVREMAAGSRRLYHSDLAISTSGIAGPGGGTPEKPVGTVCIGLSFGQYEHQEIVHLPGDRQRVTERAVNTALISALRFIRSHPEVS